ncbi:MAG: PLP-dependent transferase [Alphaproteobacteria bacterium]|nr:PLP-dependent transferase [Alphaproteobacteria bacterium]MCD8525645.1 PLP-dependent transferase [Alphaproteobacteria bacterium]MCD8570045.1 PLP-dependent transferase [Alphaproteobacteria bacterium]
MKKETSAPATRLVQAAIGDDAAHKAVIPPLYLSSTYKMESLEDHPHYSYSRVRNPTRDHLCDALADLEEGYGAAVTSSGMAALALVLQLLKPGDLLIAPYDCYGRAYRLMAALAEKGHFKLEFMDQYASDSAQMIAAKKSRMVLIESPSNPVMRLADIESITRTVKTQNPECIVVCDNTFLSPALQKPLTLGADIAFHSTTKFLNGHSDVVGGAVITKTKELWDELDFWANSFGLIGAPFDSYMTLRGLRTLNIRINKAQDNARAIVEFLRGQDHVEALYYPGIGAMLSFELKGDVKAFTDRLEIFALAQSLGGTESLICHPASMTHVAMGAEAREKAGVKENLLRLSVGIEEAEDLIADLSTAFS